MRGDGIARVMLSGIAIGAVSVGLWAVGGPATGGKERRDDRRLQDLRTLQTDIDCIASSHNDLLPETLVDLGACMPSAQGITDPASGQPYRYARKSDRSYILCADFETDLSQIPDSAVHRFDPATGCFSYQLDE